MRTLTILGGLTGMLAATCARPRTEGPVQAQIGAEVEQLAGATQQPGAFGAMPRCHAAGTGKRFQIAGCPPFNSTIEASEPIQLRVRAGAVSLSLVVASQPTTREPVQLTVDGLTASTDHFLKVDGGPSQVLRSDASGKARFTLDVAKEHMVIFSAVRGSLQLSPATCVPPVGQMESGVTGPTCRLRQDIPDADVTLTADNFVLDCRDPIDQTTFHTIGSNAVRHSFGVLAFQRSGVGIRNCPILNVDTGVSVQSSSFVTVQFTTVEGPQTVGPVTAGLGVSHVDSPNGEYRDLLVSRVQQGLFAINSDNLTITRSGFVTSMEAVILQAQSGSRIDRMIVDDSESRTIPPASLPTSAVLMSDLQSAEVTALEVSGRTPYLRAVWLLNSTAELSGLTVKGALTGVFLESGDTTLTESTLTGNEIGLGVLGGVNRIFRNNIFGNRARQVDATDPIELSRTVGPSFPVQDGEGNYWGHACPNALFTAGTDSNAVDVVDSYPYGNPSGWTFEPSGCSGRTACISGPNCTFLDGCGGVTTCSGLFLPTGGCWCESIPGGGTASRACTVCGGQGTITCNLTTCEAVGRCTRPEECNGCDDDGDGHNDNGVPTLVYHRDSDGDGYGANDAGTSFACAALPSGWVRNGADCNDSNSSVHPGAKEICGNAVDDNCNGVQDDPVPPLTILVTLANGVAALGAEVFINGVSFGVVDANGLLVTPALSCGDKVLFARFRSAPDRMEYRRGPLNWKVRHYQTSRVVQMDGTVKDHPVVNPGILQVLTVDPKNTMLGWRIVASLNFDASEADLAQLANAFNGASQYLYNLTDGQFFIEEVEIGDDGDAWERAEFQLNVYASLRASTSWPGGFTGPVGGQNPVIFLGPFFANGNPTNGKVYIHELGHLAMGLRDEYDQGTPFARCTPGRLGSDPQFGVNGPRAACAMDNQEETNKYCSAHKDSTHRGGVSWQPGPCWETIFTGWSDNQANPPRWLIQTPDRRNPNQLVGTLDPLPSGLMPTFLPTPSAANKVTDPLCAPITFADPNGPDAFGGAVYVVSSPSSMVQRRFKAGKLDRNGRLVVRGVHAGDTIMSPFDTITATVGFNCRIVP